MTSLKKEAATWASTSTSDPDPELLRLTPCSWNPRGASLETSDHKPPDSNSLPFAEVLPPVLP